MTTATIESTLKATLGPHAYDLNRHSLRELESSEAAELVSNTIVLHRNNDRVNEVVSISNTLNPNRNKKRTVEIINKMILENKELSKPEKLAVLKITTR